VTLLQKLYELNLRLIFLTSRPVDHIHETRKFLLEVAEEDASIPESPLFMSQDFVLEALYREVIARNGAVVKAGILANIRDAFGRAGRNSCPFILGFGNKKSDGVAYTESGILPDYVFIIDTSSKLKTWPAFCPDGTAFVEEDSTFATYRDPKLLGFLDESFRRPGTQPVFAALEPQEALESIGASAVRDGDEEHSEVESYSPNL